MFLYTYGFVVLIGVSGVVSNLFGIGDIDVDPANYGLNCTKTDFLIVYLTCLSEYKPEDAIKDCTLQCNIVNEVVECVNKIEDGLPLPCLASLADVMTNTSDAIKTLLFDENTIRSCNLDVSSVVALCPGMKPFKHAVWTVWGEYGNCEGTYCNSQIQVRTRQCVNQLSYTPSPEPSDGCMGSSQQSKPCQLPECVSKPDVTTSGTKTSEGVSVSHSMTILFPTFACAILVVFSYNS